MSSPVDPPRGPRPGALRKEDWDELESAVHRDWVRERLSHALDRLTEEQREIVRLRFVDEWEVEVVAEITGRTPAEVLRIQRAAIEALRLDLGSPS